MPEVAPEGGGSHNTSRLSLPNQGNYEYPYGFAYELACEQLARVKDIEEQCGNTGAHYQVINSQKIIRLDYLNRSYQVTLPQVGISLEDSKEGVPLRDKILILHYFNQAKGTPISNRLIAFKELREGAGYFPTFSKRAIKPLVEYFGKEPHRLLDAASIFGGQKADYGDAAVTIKAFSQLPITLVLWRGDEEFPSEGNFLFDSTVLDYLPTEDIIVLCQTISWKLVKLSQGTQTG